jgi:hypothetical protein
MSRIIYYLYEGEYNPSNVPEIFQRLCADPDELTHDGSEDRETMNQDCVFDRSNTREPDGKSLRAVKVAAMVYKSSDMMMIDDLKSCAAEHLLTYTREHFHDHDFHGALRTMCENTSANDEGLRLPVMEIMLRNRNDPCGKRHLHEKTIEVLREYSAGFWDLAKNELNEEEARWKAKLDSNVRDYEASLRAHAYMVESDLNKDDIRCKHRKKLYFQASDLGLRGTTRDTNLRQWGFAAHSTCGKHSCGGKYGNNYWEDYWEDPS